MTQKNFFYPFKTSDIPVTLDFTGNDNDTVDNNSWNDESYLAGSAVITGNKLRATTGAGAGTGVIRSKFGLIGDFDIQINFDLIASPATLSWVSALEINSGDGFYFTVRREYSGFGHAYFMYNYNGTSNDQAYVATSDATGILRITRVSNVYTAYFWNGSGWGQVGTTYTNSPISNKPSGEIVIQAGNFNSNPTATCDFSAFKINSCDGIVWNHKFIDTFNNVAAPTTAPVTSGDLPWTETFDTLDLTRWSTQGTGGSAGIVGGKLHFNNTGTYERVYSDFTLQGDFDINIDLTMGTYSNSNIWKCMFYVQGTDGKAINILREYSGSGKISRYYWNLVTFLEQANTASADIANLRIARVGSTFHVYVDDVELGSPMTGAMTDIVTVFIQNESASNNPQVESFWDNFTITSAGTVNNLSDTVLVPETPTENWWANNIGAFNVTNNALYSNGTTTDNMNSLFKLKGDFDIQMDFNLLTYAAVNSWGVGIQVSEELDDKNLYDFYRGSTSGINGYTGSSFNNYVGANLGLFSRDDASGKLRITRIGDDFTSYYWNGSSWAVYYTGTHTNMPSNLYIRIMSSHWETSTLIECEITNFIINSCDKIVWPGGTLKRWNGTAWVSTEINSPKQVSFDGTFTGNDGDLPQDAYWGSYGSTVMNIQGNRLNWNVSGTGTSAYVLSNFVIPSGDFDIRLYQIINSVVLNGVNTNYILCDLLSEPGSTLLGRIGYLLNSSSTKSYYTLNGVDISSQSFSTGQGLTTPIGNYFRLLRTSGAIKVGYSDDSGNINSTYTWFGVSGGQIVTNNNNSPVRIRLYGILGDGNEWNVSWDDVTITPSVSTSATWSDAILKRVSTPKNIENNGVNGSSVDSTGEWTIIAETNTNLTFQDGWLQNVAIAGQKPLVDIYSTQSFGGDFQIEFLCRFDPDANIVWEMGLEDSTRTKIQHIRGQDVFNYVFNDSGVGGANGYMDSGSFQAWPSGAYFKIRITRTGTSITWEYGDHPTDPNLITIDGIAKTFTGQTTDDLRLYFYSNPLNSVPGTPIFEIGYVNVLSGGYVASDWKYVGNIS